MSSLLTTSLSQSPSEVFMVRPGNFMFNTETAVTNHYQDIASNNMEWHEVAMQEFDNAVETLRKNKVKVTVFQDTQDPIKPGMKIPMRRIFILLIILQMLSSLTIGYPVTRPGRWCSTPWPVLTGGLRSGRMWWTGSKPTLRYVPYRGRKHTILPPLEDD